MISKLQLDVVTTVRRLYRRLGIRCRLTSAIRRVVTSL